MEYTGERMIPEQALATTVWEHIYRYRFALKYTYGRNVLDIACGEGYGTAAIRTAGATSVIGVDIDPATCDHARKKYGIDVRVGDAMAIPLPDRSVDVVVSFETIEHVPDPAKFVDEVARILRPGGTLVVSTPNVVIYNPNREPGHNPFHCSELTEGEFDAVLARRFPERKMYSQAIRWARASSFRSLAAVQSRWSNVFGHAWLRSWSMPARPEAMRRVREDVISTILCREHWLGQYLHPYRVRPRSAWSREQAEYLVCVARAAD